MENIYFNIDYSMERFFLLFVFIFGSVMASFLCLAVDRLPHQLGWRDDPMKNYNILYPPSTCFSCKKKIPALYLIPILGFLFCRGRCFSCHGKIPVSYFFIELFGAVGSVSLVLFLGFTLKGGVSVLIFLSLIFLSLIDMKEHWLPAVVTFPLFWIGLLFSPFEPDASSRIWGAFICFILIYLSMVTVSKLKGEDVFAGGDIALASASGAWVGVDSAMNFLLISSLSFILYSLPLRFKGVTFVPMGPALSLGLFLCLVF